MSDTIYLFTICIDQYHNFLYINGNIGSSINNLDFCIDSLNKITPKLDSIKGDVTLDTLEANATALNLKDLVIEARDIIKKLKLVLEEKYKLADEKKEKHNR